MIDRGKRSVLGVCVNVIDYEAAVDQVIGAAESEQPLAVSALAVHGVMTGVLDPTHRYRLNRLDIVAPDGQPVRWALNRLHAAALPERVYGPQLMLEVCARAAEQDLPVFLYGSRDEVLEALARNLRERFPALQIAGSTPSMFRQTTVDEKHAIARTIRDSGAKLVFVGLGCPRQEVWAYEYRAALGMPALAVGAAFDFHAGLLSQAPPVMQRWGLEWLYRLTREPLRLWRRYVLLNPLYLFLLGLQALKLRRFDPEDVRAPVEEMRYG